MYFPFLSLIFPFPQVMALGVVAAPTEANGHDGAIFFKRICEEVKYKKTVYCKNISDVGWVNASLKEGEWRLLVPDDDDGCTLEDLRETVCQNYGIEEDIAERLVLKYYSAPNPSNGKRKAIYVDVPSRRITRDDCERMDYTLVVKWKSGGKRSVDCSCDSVFSVFSCSSLLRQQSQ